MSTTTSRISSLVREAVSTATGLDPRLLLDSTPIVETNMDSLTLVSVVSHVENAFDIVFSTDDLAEILRARDIAELAAAVARRIGASADANSRELPKNACCAEDANGL